MYSRSSVRSRVLTIAMSVAAALVLFGCGWGDNPWEYYGETPPSQRSYTVSFSGNGYTDGYVPSSMSAVSGNSITLPNAGSMARTGYTFSGWNTSSYGNGNSYSAGSYYTVYDNVTLYAMWTYLPTYTVSFNGNGYTGGSVPSSMSAISGNSITLPGAGSMARSGYTFDGWNTNSSGTGTTYSAGDYYTVDSDVTLYAVWTWPGKGNDISNYRTVTIGSQTWMAENLDYKPSSGNSWCYDDDESNCAKYGRLYDWSTAKTVCPTGWHLPSRSEWTELVDYAGGYYNAGKKLKSTTGWNYYSDDYVGTDDYGFSALPGGYRSTDGSFYNVGILGYWWTATEYDSDYAYRRYMLYNYDYVTEYYDVKTFGFSVRCVLGEGQATQYTVTFNINGGSGTAPSSQTVNSGNSITLPGQGSMTRSGYTFGGWSTNNSGTGTTYSAGSYYTVNSNVTLYAVWTFLQTYTVSFSGNGYTGGSVPSSISAAYGSSVALPGAGSMTRSGYTFGGWNTSSYGTGSTVWSSYTVYDNVTLYAVWTIQNYTVSFSGNGYTGGSVPSSISAAYGSSVALPGAGSMARTGYTFGGWNTSSYGTGSTVWSSYTVYDNVTLYAVWTYRGSATLYGDILTDSDGKSYRTVAIGSQRWMAENLDYEPLWGNSWCYNDNSSNCDTYGRLYDWYTAKAVCPAGWHLPSRSEWDELVNYAGGSSTAGKKLKSTTGWNYYSDSYIGTDDYGFSALPGGVRHIDGSFDDVGYGGYWWTATEYGSDDAYRRDMGYFYDRVYESNGGPLGYSVRCVMD